jgi:NAD-dependent dihydropyrimidine dehydrogenase PreA subunit
MGYFGMSKLALKWALTKPPTTRYPFEPRNPIAGSRGQLVFTKDNCVYCTVCAKKCPTGALLVNRAQKKWAIDRFALHHLRLLRRNLPQEIAGAGHGSRQPGGDARPRVFLNQSK